MFSLDWKFVLKCPDKEMKHIDKTKRLLVDLKKTTLPKLVHCELNLLDQNVTHHIH